MMVSESCRLKCTTSRANKKRHLKCRESSLQRAYLYNIILYYIMFAGEGTASEMYNYARAARREIQS